MTTLEEDRNRFKSSTSDLNPLIIDLEKGNKTEIVEEKEEQPEVDIVINNVVCSFNVRCHLNLRRIALHGKNVIYKKENGMLSMKLRNPYTTASIWSSGKISCTGATSEEMSKVAARKYARVLQKLGFQVRFTNFRVVNVLGTCIMPFGIHIVNFSQKHRKFASYEPELHPGVTYRISDLKATLKIFSTGSITVTARNVANVQAAIEHIFPLIYEHRKELDPNNLAKNGRSKHLVHLKKEQFTFSEEDDDEEEDELVESDQSWD
ncbi:TATA box-binding protein-like protein 1 [Centruroides sculpturatus]|uniref:TATA box-binding protein-like protein 1 n=1 Tax=Centruroides sculpturatus TaxID=218467 RepID=UPI000C6DA5EE|nr:TATA box-binding protein-like protein 1 [Centruroides sculpturatus]XP_023228082.1 TATA box-binding protein-like protein 1 [Centruroides sculpturatus]